MTKKIGPSEYEGVGTEETGIFDVPPSALSNGDKLRLGYLTGQQTDATAPVSSDHFNGARWMTAEEAAAWDISTLDDGQSFVG